MLHNFVLIYKMDNEERLTHSMFTMYDPEFNVLFKTRLIGGRCQGHRLNGARCKRRCVLCWQYCVDHLITEKHLQIKPSTIAGAGKGLFARNPDLPDNAIVFKTGDKIMEYSGEEIPLAEVQQRYHSEHTGRNYTAPYAFRVDSMRAIDAAGKRGAASFANSSRGTGGRPNARFSVSNNTHNVSVKASRNITNNSEIFIAYGNSYRLPHEEGVTYQTKPYETKY
jgi:hypothetical protein